MTTEPQMREQLPGNFDWCPHCRGTLDTGNECNDCGRDWMPVVQAAHQSATEQMRVPEDYVTRRDYETMVRERDYHQAMEQGLFEDNERLGKQAEQMKPLVEACGKLTWEFATDGNYCKPMALVEHSKLVAIAQALSLATIEQREKR